MSDIFISYKKEDAGRVVRIVEALRAEGFSVWWDHGIAPGAQWDQTIQAQLDAAKAVVAVWSAQSRDAPWVKEESAVGKNRGILVPIRIDEVDPPLGFTLIQVSDLVGWAGDVKDPRWVHFSAALKAVLSGRTPTGLDAPLRQTRRGPPWALLAGVVVAVALAAAAYVMMQPGAPMVATPTTPPPQSSAPPSPDSGPASGPEQAMFTQAQTQKTRSAWQSFLAAYPNSALAPRARDALLMCRMETRPLVKTGVQISNQSVRGVGDTASKGPSEANACAAAKAMARAQAETNCRGFTTNATYSNPNWTVADASCTCTAQNASVTVCIVDMAATCQVDQATRETIEICE